VLSGLAYGKLIDLVRKLDSGGVEVPLMQRDYVWPAAKVVSLLDSLYRGWPIGSVSEFGYRNDRENSTGLNSDNTGRVLYQDAFDFI
jgi:hypothetical protein